MKDKMMIVGIFIIVSMLLVSMPTNALTADDFNFSGTDESGDISDTNLDLISASATVYGDDVVFQMTVSGEIVEDDSNYTYTFTAQDTGAVHQMMITYLAGNATYVVGIGNLPTLAQYEIAGSTLKIIVPLSAFSSFENIEFITATTLNTSNLQGDQIVMWAYSSGGDSGSSDTLGERCPDPSTEEPTDTSISIEITKVYISFEKMDDGANIHMVMIIKGTTSGVDHVSLNTVWYYKNGSHDWGYSWLRGPMGPPPFTLPGIVINQMSFDSTSGDWNTWELNIDIEEPAIYMKGNYSGAMHMSNITKVRIYARAYADADETQWNQDYYEFTPSVSSTGDSMTYDSTEEGSSTGSGGGLPGFEVIGFIAAISLAMVIYTAKKK